MHSTWIHIIALNVIDTLDVYWAQISVACFISPCHHTSTLTEQKTLCDFIFSDVISWRTGGLSVCVLICWCVCHTGEMSTTLTPNSNHIFRHILCPHADTNSIKLTLLTLRPYKHTPTGKGTVNTQVHFIKQPQARLTLWGSLYDKH